MQRVDWSSLELKPEIRREATTDPDHVILWIPVDDSDQRRCWQRVGSTEAGGFTVEPGVVAVSAWLMEVCEKRRGLWSRLWTRDEFEGGEWLHPDGVVTQQTGDRDTRRLLVFADRPGRLDESFIRKRWPRTTSVCTLADRLVLIDGIDTDLSRADSDPVEQANTALTAARADDDRTTEIAALVDRGIALRGNGDPARAVVDLKEALGLCNKGESPSLEQDVLLHLGAALVEAGDVDAAQQVLDRSLSGARELRDQYNEKFALTWLGRCHVERADQSAAVATWTQALELSITLGDRSHTAKLLWDIARQHLRLGQDDAAVQSGRRAVALMREMGHPDAVTYENQINDYLRRNDVSAAADADSELDSFFAGIPADAEASENENTPGLLAMAASAASAAGHAARTGFKRVNAETRTSRLRTCGVCEHHTGIRCRLCGCFTSVKSWLPFAECPIGRWDAGPHDER